MKKIRKGVFETNSSSTHSLAFNKPFDNYAPAAHSIIVEFFDDEPYMIDTLKEKVSYLVSHIVRKYQFDSIDYEDLLDNVKADYEFKKLEDYVKTAYGKDIVFPKTYNGDLEYITEINHQLVENSLEDVLDDLLRYSEEDKLARVLQNGTAIIFGRD